MRIIAGACKGRVLKTITGPGYRPAMSIVRESLFSMLEARGVVWGGVRVLDLFAGSGSLGLEALSRGAQEAFFVEKDAKAAVCLNGNAKTLGVENRCRVVADDVVKVLARRPVHPYDIIFVDPPYGQSLLGPSLRNILRYSWLTDDGFLIAEVEKHLPLPEPKGLILETERLYGQTRIAVWINPDNTDALDNPEPEA